MSYGSNNWNFTERGKRRENRRTMVQLAGESSTCPCCEWVVRGAIALQLKLAARTGARIPRSLRAANEELGK